MSSPLDLAWRVAGDLRAEAVWPQGTASLCRPRVILRGRVGSFWLLITVQLNMRSVYSHPPRARHHARHGDQQLYPPGSTLGAEETECSGT